MATSAVRTQLKLDLVRPLLSLQTEPKNGRTIRDFHNGDVYRNRGDSEAHP